MLLHLSISCHAHTRASGTRANAAGGCDAAWPLESRSEDASPARPSRSLTSLLCQRGAPWPGGAAPAELGAGDAENLLPLLWFGGIAARRLPVP